MKRALLILSAILMAWPLYADYNGYHITFTIEAHDGSRIKGFAYVASAYLNMDSLQNTAYLARAFDQRWGAGSEGDSLSYFADRIRYTYRNVGADAGDTSLIYHLLNLEQIPHTNIHSITILDMVEFGYGIGISNDIELRDTRWMEQEPVMSAAVGAYLCSHQVFIHRNSRKARELLQKLELKQAEIDKIEIDGENGDRLDQEIWEILEGFRGRYVVIVTECSC